MKGKEAYSWMLNIILEIAQRRDLTMPSSGLGTCNMLQGEVVSPLPNPHPGGPGLCIYDSQRHGGLAQPLGSG